MTDPGTIGILNVGAGDTKLSFDPKQPAERKRAAKVVADMLRRGYAILVQVGERDGKPLYQRAEGFDPETCEYIIVGTPPEATPNLKTTLKRTRRQRRGSLTTRVPASKTSAVAVARSAGG